MRIKTERSALHTAKDFVKYHMEHVTSDDELRSVAYVMGHVDKELFLKQLKEDIGVDDFDIKDIIHGQVVYSNGRSFFFEEDVYGEIVTYVKYE